MIRFFRNIREKLLFTNKGGAYFLYAAGEIILVVAGILIALQIDNWNEDRIERKEEVSILKGLKKEYENNIISFDSMYDIHNIKHQQLKIIVNADLDTWYLEDFDAVFYPVFSNPTYDPGLSLLSSIIASGKIELIQNEDLRKKLLQLTGVIGDYREDEFLIRDIVLNQLLPYYNKYGIHDFEIIQGDRLRSEEEKQLHLQRYRKIYKSLEFRNILNTIYGLEHYGPIQESKILKQQLANTLTMINAELKKKE